MLNMQLQLKKLGVSMEHYGAKHGYHREWCWRRAISNNNTWLNKLSIVELLRDLGETVRLGPMLSRET